MFTAALKGEPLPGVTNGKDQTARPSATARASVYSPTIQHSAAAV